MYPGGMLGLGMSHAWAIYEALSLRSRGASDDGCRIGASPAISETAITLATKTTATIPRLIAQAPAQSIPGWTLGFWPAFIAAQYAPGFRRASFVA
jgi:hypothetical protein